MQDTSESSAHQESMGGGFSASMGGASGSFSYSRGNASGNYAGVVEQSGIQAGAGGFDVDVKGNTDLKGAYIASTADPSKNQLTTGTLTYSDIQNHSDYSANSFGFGGGGTFGNGGANERTTGPSSGKNTGGIAPMLPQSESGSERGVTRSGVSDGTITLTNGANQTQDLASLNRDTSNLNETVNRTPDLQNLLNDQSRLMAAATAAGEAVARDIGTYADKKREAALKMAGATTDPELKAQYQKEADDWKEGGDYRAAMHAAGGAIIAGLGGGNALGGALGAGLTSKLGGTLNELSENIQKARPTGNADIDQALAQIVATGVGTAVGAAVGGGSGAFAGYNVDRFNRQLHPDERTWAKDNAKSFAEFYERTTGKAISQGQAENMLLANGYRLVDEIASKGPGGDPVAIAYINQVATGLFQTTSEEFRKPLMNGNRDGSPTPEQLALPAARGNPALGLTVVAGVLTAGVAPEIAAGVVAASRVCATNIVLCMNQIGIGSGELFASSAMPAGTGAAVAMAAKINNFYRDGAAPELLQQAYRQAAVSSTHNAASSEVVLGKYIAGSESSYEAVAASRGSTYFSMSDWNAVQGQMGADKMWNINRAFLDQQMAQGKNFVFTLDPRSVSELSYTAKEYDYLQRNGYVLQEGTGGLFHAIKK